jgi:Tfp pilus assembly protein PilF
MERSQRLGQRGCGRRLQALGLGGFILYAGVACGGGAAEQRPTASAADARLADPAADAPEASPFVREGEGKLGQDDAAGAKTLFEQALAQNPGDARAALDLGIADELLGDGVGAEAAYRKALVIKPDLTQAQNNLGVLLREKGALPEAIKLLKSAAASSPDSAPAHQNLALVYEDSGDSDAAASEYARALELTPDDAMTRANYGLLLLKQQRKDAAVQQLSRAAKAAQGNRAALLAIGNGLRRAGATDEALAAMQAAVDAPGEAATPALLSELALAQRAANQRDAALATLQKALSIDDNYATAHYLLANMLASEQRFPEAKKHYERYLKLAPEGEQAARARERLAVIQKRK